MKKKSFWFDLLEMIVTSGIIIFIVLTFLIFPCRVDGNSMYPTLKNDEKCYSFILTKNLGIHRFDICVIKNIDDSDKKIVKRVIGLPNETIEYKDNKLYIDGVYYEEDFLMDTTTEDFKVTLGENEYYCLGDNRMISKDSRYYGPFKKDDFVSTHILIVYPFSDFGYQK